MIRQYCDICINQITPKELVGSMTYFEKNWLEAIKVGTEKSIVRKDLLFCETCLDDIKTYIAKNQKDQNTVDRQKS